MDCWDDWCIPNETDYLLFPDSVRLHLRFKTQRKQLYDFPTWVTFPCLNQGLVGRLDGQSHQDCMQ